MSFVWFASASADAAEVVSASGPEGRPLQLAPKILRGGWYPWDPYQYGEYRRGVSVLTGFDVEIERAIAR